MGIRLLRRAAMFGPAGLHPADGMLGRQLLWIRRSALGRIRDGIGLMDGDHPEMRAGFVKRAKLQLIEALEQSGAAEEAAAARLARDSFSRANGLSIN